jgi:hypothetical protein
MHHDTTEFADTVVTVVVPVVPVPDLVAFVAGVASTCAPDQRSTTMLCRVLTAVATVEDTVIAPGDPDTVATYTAHQPLKPPGAAVPTSVYVWVPPVGAFIPSVVDQVVSLTTMISPLDGVNEVVVSVVWSADAEYTS